MVEIVSSKYMVVNAGVASVYREAAFGSELVTQAILGEPLTVLDQRDEWFRIQQWDGYQGWVYHFYLTGNPDYLSSGTVVQVQLPVALIREQPQPDAPPVREAVFGCRLPVMSRQEDWLQVALPDGQAGWLKQKPLKPGGSRRERVAASAQGFLGIPYLWGGKTPRGFDCSGLVQTCFKGIGVTLPRDASQQIQYGQLPDISFAAAQAGDLLFFSEADGRIGHVAIALGSSEFIHASGWVKRESLAENSPHFNRQLRSKFTTGKDVTELLDGQ